MQADQLTFGIEFETTMPAGSVNMGSWSSPNQVPWLPQGWTAKPDCSIRAGRGRVGVEFVSPVLRGADGLAQVIAVIGILVARGAKVNKSTGLHIHVGGFDMGHSTIERLTTLVANFEKAIYASTGTRSRETGVYCRSTAAHGSAANAIRSGNRYHVLNLTNITRPNKRTVEFRAFAGSLNVIKVVGYLRMCLGLVERATEAKRKTDWAAKPVKDSSPIHRNGEGQTALTRLFYQLGWTKGRTSRVYGFIPAPGDMPTMKTIKREFIRLAKQYDRGLDGSEG